VALYGPAVVASVAYIDLRNSATNITAGAKFGYTLVWMVVVANAMAVLVQYLSAKLGIATRRSLPELCRSHLPKPVPNRDWLSMARGR
jgi:manganese transport protein